MVKKKNVNDLDVILDELKRYLNHCKKDKYSAGGDSGVDTGADLLGENSAIVNCFQIKRYLQRYQTTGFIKSRLREDLFKIIHYAMFELEATRVVSKPEPFTGISICDICMKNDIVTSGNEFSLGPNAGPDDRICADCGTKWVTNGKN